MKRFQIVSECLRATEPIVSILSVTQSVISTIFPVRTVFNASAFSHNAFSIQGCVPYHFDSLVKIVLPIEIGITGGTETFKYLYILLFRANPVVFIFPGEQ